MAQPDNVEARLSALETNVRDLTAEVRATKQDAAAARVLARGADRDVSEFRGELRDFRQATTSSFNAMRADLTDVRTDLTDVRADLTDLRQHVDTGFAEIRTEMRSGFAQVRGALDASAAGHQQIAGLLNTLIAQQGESAADQ